MGDNGGKNKMDTKRNYHSELLEFISDDSCRHIGIFHISPDDPGYCYNYSNYRFESVHSIAEWIGPLEYAE